MAEKKMVTMDGNTAAAYVAHATNEVIAIYPITPSSPMGELSDMYSSQGRKNIWGTIPCVSELQSEAGAAGTVHGALTTGALTTTFTASQGLLLKIPNMFKIAGELTPTVFHIAARALSTQGLSIFGDHSDVMAARTTGFAMLSSNNVQEVQDIALIAQEATLRSRVPFLHFFDGFRTSHEEQKIEEISYDIMRQMISDDLVRAHRARGLTPEKPALRGTSQNPDVYFTARETCNTYYAKTPGIVQEVMDKFAKLTGRQYKLYEYFGAPDAERVAILMGSAVECMEETVEYLMSKGEKVGLLKVRLFRPFAIEKFVEALPATVKAIAVLDRTKEPGSLGEPLYEDVRTAIGEVMGAGNSKFKSYPKTVGGRYGLGSYEFTPAMAKAVLDNLKNDKPKNHFTVGINDDLGKTSLEYDQAFSLPSEGLHTALFYGLGSDGTVGANKNSIQIIGNATENYAQGYYVYDSKKSGTITVSHLRFGKKAIKSTYLIPKAGFVACHKYSFIEKVDMLASAAAGATFLLASPYGKDEIWDKLPMEVQKQIIDKNLKFYVIDAMKIAEEKGMGTRINVIMQTAFFKISGVLPEDEAIALIKGAIQKTYGGKGKDIVEKNISTIDAALAGVQQVNYPKTVSSKTKMLPPVPESAPKFVKEVIGEIIMGRGDKLPTSKIPDDGTWPTATTQYEKRNIAEYIPVWDSALCIQCGDCSAVCPHGVIRMKVYDKSYAEKAPKTFKSCDAKGKEFEGMKFSIQVSPEDCTGCGVCVNICPAKSKTEADKKAINMQAQPPLREQEVENWNYFTTIPNTDTKILNLSSARGTQLLQPLFEFSGACAGCGETPYVKLLSQLFGDRMVIANATGCSSIYGGNLPTTPYSKRADGRGPVWSNSLFEDAAEFGLGMRLSSDKHTEYAHELLNKAIADSSFSGCTDVMKKILENKQNTQEEIETQRGYVADLKGKLSSHSSPLAKEILSLTDNLIRRSVWIFGGDGWAYDIGFGGLDHVIASGKNVNLLVMDTEVYSNTGGQMSKATPIGAIAKFAAGGKPIRKKDLGMIAMSYGYVYVARIAMGSSRTQAIKAIREAESYDGPSIIIAYSHCIAHGIDMSRGLEQQKAAVTSGIWPLYRYDPRLAAQGKNPFQLDSKEPTTDPADYMYNEIRYRSLKQARPEQAQVFLEKARADAAAQYKAYKYLADRPF